ncbi:glycoside hydrolase family 95 protein [Limnovirga soli]|uniref:Glycoside hydrolase family 95 protein n=1 Tax=Limnovirga soli TaxID=2656915 RepID=A0A8J8FHA7_9BACT|nr:glycoside hydrolase family 95 protein [Limnovirga soli]NNV57128.1 glycoside hydrolase family 95 protein [Limnovirga soli]
MMKYTRFIAICITAVSLQANAQQPLKLWYKQPAEVWTEALPIGNGRLGAMVFGKMNEELLQLNEATLWAGGPVKTNVNPGAKDYLPQVREALSKGEYDKAIQLEKKMQGLYSESYLPLGDVLIQQQLPNQTPTAYYRDLNISDAIATTRFTIGGVAYTREIFSSAASQVIVVRLRSSKAKTINALVKANSQLHYQNVIISNNQMALKGKAPAHADPSYFNDNKEPVIYADSTTCRGMRFELLLKASSTDGKITTDTAGIHIENATEVILLLSAATSFNGFDKCPDKEGVDENALALQYLSLANHKTYAALLQDHLADYHHYFNRVSFTINNNASSKDQLATDERLEAYTKGGLDDGLESLYFQYGRYLLIASSRTPEAPANLQGIWNKELRPPWSANYTININAQMNYWPAEVCNLSELHQPLINLIKHIAVTGAVTAKEFYGADGWVAHHNSDIWALSNPVGDLGKGDPKWANWAMGANWLCNHLWQHYQFTGDTAFLRNTAYPLIKGAVIFTRSWLVKDSNGHLVTSPSLSPENSFFYGDKKVADVSVATTMDMGIIRDLFGEFTQAAAILGVDANLQQGVAEDTKKLYPFQIGKKGNLQEWYKDFDDVEPTHRHVSHLYALHPGNQLSPITTPALADAAKKTLEIRGDDGTGWSLAWKVNFWARLLDGDHAYKLYRNLFRLVKENNFNYSNGGGAYPNMFDAHPPFQIDGNFGGTAGVAEMLLQSQNNELHLLPALPAAWQTGTIKGLRARGSFEISMQWQQQAITHATILSLQGNTCHIRTQTPVKLKGTNLVSVKSTIGYTLSFTTVKGKVYELIKP